MNCPFCEHSPKTALLDNVGFDMDEEGEETQHKEYCPDCGAWRFKIEHQPWIGNREIRYGKWHETEEDDFFDFYP